jgi:hypothetical protein
VGLFRGATGHEFPRPRPSDPDFGCTLCRPPGEPRNVIPLPGGLGGFELALITVVVVLTGLDVPTGTAGVLLYRLVVIIVADYRVDRTLSCDRSRKLKVITISAYWFLLLIGGLATSYLSPGRQTPRAVVIARGCPPSIC